MQTLTCIKLLKCIDVCTDGAIKMQRLLKNSDLLLLIALTYGSKNCGKNRCMHTCNNFVTVVSKVIARDVMINDTGYR